MLLLPQSTLPIAPSSKLTQDKFCALVPARVVAFTSSRGSNKPLQVMLILSMTTKMARSKSFMYVVPVRTNQSGLPVGLYMFYMGTIRTDTQH